MFAWALTGHFLHAVPTTFKWSKLLICFPSTWVRVIIYTSTTIPLTGSSQRAAHKNSSLKVGKGNVKAERQCAAAGDRILELLVIGQLIRKHQIPKLWWLLFIQWCPTFCNPMDCGTPGFPVLHYLGVCSNSCPLNCWCHLTISSSVDRFSCPESFPASGSFLMSRLFTSGGQNIGASASASVLNLLNFN